MKDAIIEVIKWIRESVRPVVVILVLSGVLLFSPILMPENIYQEMRAMFPQSRFLAFLCFIGSFVWLASFPIERQYRHRKRKRYLNHLTREEREVLRLFVLDAKKTQAFRMNLAIARHLAQQHLLTETSTEDVRGHTVFVMDDWAFSYLRKHTNLLDL